MVTDADDTRPAESCCEQTKCRRCGFVSDHISGRPAAVLVAVGVVHVLPYSRRADTDVLDAHLDFYARNAHTCTPCAQGKAKPSAIPAVPRADVYVAAYVHYPNWRPRPKCSVGTVYRNFEFAGGIDKSELLSCPAHQSGGCRGGFGGQGARGGRRAPSALHLSAGKQLAHAAHDRATELKSRGNQVLA